MVWYIEQKRERARLVWRDYDRSTVPPDYQDYYARDQRLASGPHPGEPTPEDEREAGVKCCVGTPADCIRFLELYQALGIEEAILLCAVGPAQHEEVIPHFQVREPRTAVSYEPGRSRRQLESLRNCREYVVVSRKIGRDWKLPTDIWNTNKCPELRRHPIQGEDQPKK